MCDSCEGRSPRAPSPPVPSPSELSLFGVENAKRVLPSALGLGRRPQTGDGELEPSAVHRLDEFQRRRLREGAVSAATLSLLGFTDSSASVTPAGLGDILSFKI